MGSNVVDVWHVRIDALTRDMIAVCEQVMARDEAERHQRFVFERNRDEFAVTRGLARGVLAAYCAARPRDLAFERTEHGRPLLIHPRVAGDAGGELRFNLTNTVELVACGVTNGAEIGIDAEPLARADMILALASTVFTPGELEMLARLSLEARQRRAVELWTLKEAYIKARGLGMALPVERIEVTFEVASGASAGAPALRFFAPVEDRAGRWALSTFEVDGHLLSTCIEVLGPSPIDVRLRRADLAALLG